MEISDVRRRLKHAMDQARESALQRRQQAGDADRAYATFLETVATPTTKQVANVLKAEGYAFTLSTPGSGLRLALDRSRDDYVELSLDTTGERPQVMARISRTRGSRTLTEERPLRADASPDAISEGDVLEFWAGALGPWLER